jgi:membrane-bound serine protease (ClpP class)
MDYYIAKWKARAMLAVALLLFACLMLAPQGKIRAQEVRSAFLVEIDGVIGPAASDYVERAIQTAQHEKAEVIILRLDTPGGLDTSMRAINRAILASPIPVVGYVAPSGARAASAGTYILYASHIAAMAPGTNLGAATPVQIGGGFPSVPPSGKPADDKKPAHPTIADKAVSDAIAYIKSLAQLRGRNVDWAEKAVREAASLSAEDARAEKVVDFLAISVPDLLKQIDQQRVETQFGQRQLATRGLTITRYEPDWRTQVLSVITNPNIAYILMLFGIYGLLFEFYSPGAIVPGVVGAISLCLALYAFHVLPINYAGLALVALGIILMASEAFVPSFGALGLGGAAAFVIGSIMLMDVEAPGFRVSPMLIGSVAAVSAGLLLAVMMMLMRARRRAVVTGPEELLGSRGQVIDWQGASGHVRVHGEVWKADAKSELQPGRWVSVNAIDGLTLTVTPQDKEALS